jgi:small subunit ribosomal protein S9
MEKENIYYATGKRKSAIARTWLTPGTGEISINNRPVEAYFPVETLRNELLEPFKLTNTAGSFNVKVSVKGGGIAGQAGAVRHGITKALILTDADLRISLKKAGFVKRDPRVKERKKYGQKGARSRVCQTRSAGQRKKKIWPKGSPGAISILKTLKRILSSYQKRGQAAAGPLFLLEDVSKVTRTRTTTSAMRRNAV